MKHLLRTCIVAAFALCATQAESKIGIIRNQGVITSLSMFKDFQKEMSEKSSKESAKFMEKRAKLENKMKDLRKKAQLAAGNAKQMQKIKAEEKELFDESEKFKTEVMVFQKEMEKNAMQISQDITKKIKEETQKLAQKKGLEVVLAEEQVVFTSPDVEDLTDQVVDAINQMGGKKDSKTEEGAAARP